MATTTNISIDKSDGWVNVVTNPTACSITANTAGNWYVAVSNSIPANDVFGERMNDYDSYVTGKVSGTIYVRAVDTGGIKFGITSEVA